MILNNFKPLVSFMITGDFKNVLGSIVDKSTVLAGQSAGYITNGHYYTSSNLQYSYTTNTGTNNFTDEQTTYSWIGVVRTQGSANVADMLNGFVLFVGSGNTAVTVSDYKLASPLTLNAISASCTPLNEKMFVQRTFLNNSANNVTVNEVGCYVFTTKQDGNKIPIVMIGRKVLDNPVTIPVGETYTFTYVLDMSNITLEQ